MSAYTNAHPLSGWIDTSQAGETRRRKELKKRVRFAQIDEQFPWRTKKRVRRLQGGGWEDEMAKAVERDRIAQQDAAEAERIKAAAARASRASLSKKR